MTIQRIIADILREEGMTQAEVAKKIGITKQALSQMINGKDMKVSTMISILTVLGYNFKISKAGEDDE